MMVKKVKNPIGLNFKNTDLQKKKHNALRCTEGYSKENKRILKTRDFGIHYGEQKILYGLANKYIYQFLKILICDIKRNFDICDNIEIGDWGGGNGIVAKELIRYLPEYKNIRITIIDLDNSKFIECPNIINVEEDVVTYKSKKKFHYSISRHVMVYMNKQDNIKFIKNVYDNTQYAFLLKTKIIDKNHKNNWNKFAFLLKEATGIERFYDDGKSIIKLIENANWKIIKQKNKTKKDFDYPMFYKNRFKLSEKEFSFIKKNNLFEKENYSISEFWCKK